MKKSAKKPGRPRQKRGVETREALVVAAVEALLQSDVYGLRLSQVAKIAGVPQSLVDYHFREFEELLMAMVLYQLGKLKRASIEAIERNSVDPRKALNAYIYAPFELAKDDRGFCAVWSSYYHLAVLHRSFGDLNRGVRETGHDRIQMLVQNILVRESRITSAPRTKTSEVASGIQGLITGCGFIALAETGGDFLALAEVVVQNANRLIDASFPLQD